MRSQRIQKKEVNFKIKPNEIGKYSTADIDLDGVSQAFLGKFTDKEIERAKELKAKQKALHEENPDHVPETAYSDEFYLNYAKSLSHEEHMGRLLEIFKNRVSGCEIQDPYWSQYSYEEILQMEQDGYQIPQDVLEWAHAQQQSDVTDYIVMSDGAETDDASSTSDVTGSDELTKLRAQSLNDIAKIEKAEKETEKEYDEYRRTEGKAKSVQARSAFFQDIEFKKLEEKTKEWKKLNEKSQAGKLRKSEESRFNQLTKELQGANSGIVSDIESNAADLDEFLGQLNKLSEKLSENEEIVTKAVQNAMDLTSIERQYDPSKLPVPTKGIRIDGNGLSTSTLYGIKTEDIAKVAIDKSRDLTASDIYTTNYISGRKTQKLTAFSSEYSEKVKEATDKTKETVGVSENESSEEKDEKTNPKNIPESRNNVTIEFSAPNSVEATETTVAATTEMLFAQAKTIKEEVNLKDKVKQAKKDVTELEQKVNTAQTKHQANLSQEEIFLMELEELNSSEETAPQAVALRQNITSIQGSDEAAVSEVAEASEKSKASTLKSRLFANVLRGETTTFEQARKTAQKVSARTLQVGVGTVARGYVNSAVGADMMYVGLVLSNSLYPPTVLMGLGLLSAGSMLYSEGVLELTTGTIATGVGFTSLETSVAAGLITGAITGSSKSSENEIASSEASITASENSVGVETNADIDTVDSTEANTIVPASEEAEVLPDITATSASAEETVQESPNTAVVNAAPNETEAPNNNNQVDELPESENKANTQETTSKENEEMIETQNPESDENVASEDPNARKAYDVKQDYSITGAVNATKTTIIATQDVLNSRSDARNNEIAFNQKISAIRKSDETAETNKNLAEAIVRQQQQRAAQITSQIENENVNIQKAAEEGNVAGFEQGQINVQNLAGSMEDMAAKESENFASSIDEVNDSISAIQADATNLRSELVDFNNKIDEQFDVSQKTIGVGAGTFGVGMAHGVAGSLMMQIGMQLELTAGVNVAQHIFAAMMMHRGTTMMLQGALEQESGLVASAAGTAGVAVHTQVNGDKVEIDSSESSGNSFLSITRSAMKLNDTTAQEVEESRQTTIDEVNLIAASATANANSVDKAETGDKAEKKLARFNKETEIESRKKRKKVIAVSASTRG